jgi:hypothetical protein
VLFRGNSQLVEEGMMPDSLHVIPVVDNTVFNGIFKVEDTSFSLSFITNVSFLVVHADHYAGHLGSADNSWETASWGIITSDTSFALTRTIVNNNCCLIFCHFQKDIFIIWIFP